MPKLIAKYAADNPFPSYKGFLLDTVIPHSHVFATLTALGEVGSRLLRCSLDCSRPWAPSLA